jgi:MFS family permease
MNKALKILLFTNGLVLVAGAMLGPIYALFVDRIGGSLLDASFAGGIFALSAGIMSIISGKFSDSIKESELVVVLGYMLMGIGFISYIFVGSIWTLFAVEILFGLSVAIYAPAFDAAYSKHLNKKKAGSQWGAWESMNYFTAAVGALIGGFVVTYLGFNVLFVIMAILCWFSGIYIYFLPRKVL